MQDLPDHSSVWNTIHTNSFFFSPPYEWLFLTAVYLFLLRYVHMHMYTLPNTPLQLSVTQSTILSSAFVQIPGKMLKGGSADLIYGCQFVPLS